METISHEEKMKKVTEIANKINYAELVQKGQLSVSTLWHIIAKQIFQGKQISQLQRDDMRKTFYMGFTECFRLMTDAADAMTEEQACHFLTKVQTEVNEFHTEEMKRLFPG